jgi:hypothetical protein
MFDHLDLSLIGSNCKACEETENDYCKDCYAELDANEELMNNWSTK